MAPDAPLLLAAAPGAAKLAARAALGGVVRGTKYPEGILLIELVDG